MSVLKPPIGQSMAIAQLEAAIAQNRLAPAYLFTGSDGIGRKLMARWLTGQLLHNSDAIAHPDMLWIEPTFTQDGQHYTFSEAEQNGFIAKSRLQIRIDQIRQIAAFVQQPPLLASRSLIVIDGAETMSEAAANALLKVLEEPGRVTVILIASAPSSLLPTIRSRCQIIRFKRLNSELLVQVLQELCPDLMQYPDLICFAQGSPGRAIAAWEILQQIPRSVIDALNQSDRLIWECFSLSQQIQALDFSLQLWLLNFLQFQTWQQSRCSKVFHKFEQARAYLIQHCQAQLVWDCMLTSLSKIQWELPSIVQASCQQISSQSSPCPEPKVSSDLVNVAPQSVLEFSTRIGGRQTDLFEAFSAKRNSEGNALNKSCSNSSIDYGNSPSSTIQSL
ncbi:ATP-binding protein [Leptolyngbya sp. NIES-2104]|uniref:ATP-binding protein n=1 Tax=Leptolyngbya sp. NIES-2104 TaxID=1552121 RepID=UPI0006EC4698|nr:ATP-binding protein [Leptolyngbya sp. NIES-2104]GAP99750.1 DNA polymerase III delta prime subunit [Leptolyngbya sp. NIES-2104]